jgi:UDP:flavonoid glycosyltransferase YjiC (YdhE family)
VNVLVVTWDGGGNRQPFEVVVDALVARGDTVRVISNEVHRDLYASLGASFVSLDVADKDPATRSDLETQIGRVREVMFSALTSRTVLQNVEDADVGLVDVVMLSAQAACERAQLPFVSMHHTLSGASWGGTRRALHESLLPNVNEMRESLGLAPLAAYSDLHLVAAGHIVPTAAALDAVAPWPVDLTYVGPLQPADRGPAPPDLPDRFVLVSFSTTWQMQVALLQHAIDALSALDLPVVVTTGPSVAPSELTASPNTIILEQLPHRAVLDRVEVVITHAGHGTVLTSLTAGVPLVCIPQGRDQYDVASRVAATSTGIVVNADDVGEQLLDGVRNVLGDPRFRAAATQMRAAIAEHRGVEQALDVIDRAARII